MPTWVWILIAAAAVLIVAMVAWVMTKRKQTKQLQSQFGPEYERTVEATDNRKAAESELAARRERREQLEIRPLSSAARERYGHQWQVVQVQFVDNPSGAVASVDQLIQSVRIAAIRSRTSRRARPTSPSIIQTSSRTTGRGIASRRRTWTATARPRISVRPCATTARCSTTSSSPPSTSRWRGNATTRRRPPTRIRQDATAARARDDSRTPVA